MAAAERSLSPAAVLRSSKRPSSGVLVPPRDARRPSVRVDWAKAGGRKVASVMQNIERARLQRRARAEEGRQARATEFAAAAGKGGIDFLEYGTRIVAYREEYGLNDAGPVFTEPGLTVWDEPSPSRIRVVVRKRPLVESELARQEFDAITVLPGSLPARVVVHEPRTRVDETKEVAHHDFRFDGAFSEAESNSSIGGAVGLQMLCGHVLDGKPATILCFGQTGSGKSLTMLGTTRVDDGANGAGLFGLAASELFQQLGAAEGGPVVFCSFYEIYRGACYDLLNKRKRLDVRDDGKGHTVITGLRHAEVGSEGAIDALVELAADSRSTGSTAANAHSSRSHAILQLRVCLASDAARLREGLVAHGGGKLNLIDLAGSERAADAASEEQQTRLEGAEINKSLLVLKECIRAIDAHRQHLPFRGSKLTHVLREAFIGDHARLVFIANVAPGSSSVEHTLNTLRYAARVKDFSSASRRTSHASLAYASSPGSFSSTPASLAASPHPASPPPSAEDTPPGSFARPQIPPLPIALALARLATLRAQQGGSTSSRGSESHHDGQSAVVRVRESTESTRGPPVAPPTDSARARSATSTTTEAPSGARGAQKEAPVSKRRARRESAEQKAQLLCEEMEIAQFAQKAALEAEAFEAMALALESESEASIQRALQATLGADLACAPSPARSPPGSPALDTDPPSPAPRVLGVGDFAASVAGMARASRASSRPSAVVESVAEVMHTPFRQIGGWLQKRPASSKNKRAASPATSAPGSRPGTPPMGVRSADDPGDVILEYMRSTAALERMEHETLSTHKEILAAERDLLQQSKELLQEVEGFDALGFASEQISSLEYIEGLEEVVRVKIELSVRLQAQLARFRVQLEREDLANRRLQALPMQTGGVRAMRALPFTAPVSPSARRQREQSAYIA